MRSNTCYLYKKEGRDKVLREVEKTAQYCELEHEQELQLRLLAEELTGMAESITGEYKGMFWIEAEDGNFYVIALGALICIPAAKWGMDLIYPYCISNVAIGMELQYPPQLYGLIYGGILLCYLVINFLLVRRLHKLVPAEVLKNRE